MSNLEDQYNNAIKKFGENLRELREARNLTQLDMDIATGMDRSEISRIENGLKNIEFLTMVKLAIALDINLSEFFINKKK